MDKDELIDYAKQVIKRKYGGLQNKFAYLNNMSPSFVSDVLLGRRNPSDRFLEAIGVEKNVSVTYRKI